MNMITDRANSILSTNNDILLYHSIRKSERGRFIPPQP